MSKATQVFEKQAITQVALINRVVGISKGNKPLGKYLAQELKVIKQTPQSRENFMATINRMTKKGQAGLAPYGGRFFGKDKVERVMTHYNVSRAVAIKRIQEGNAPLPPRGARRNVA